MRDKEREKKKTRQSLLFPQQPLQIGRCCLSTRAQPDRGRTVPGSHGGSRYPPPSPHTHTQLGVFLSGLPDKGGEGGGGQTWKGLGSTTAIEAQVTEATSHKAQKYAPHTTSHPSIHPLPGHDKQQRYKVWRHTATAREASGTAQEQSTALLLLLLLTRRKATAGCLTESLSQRLRPSQQTDGDR